MSAPVGAVQAQNPQKGVKRSLPGNPVGLSGQQPGFRGRSVAPGSAVKAPKLRNGNLNNETSNIRIPYNRVVPLEFLSSFQGRLGPGDVAFTYKYPPGFVTARADFNNATLGVNTLSRVIGLDGLNRLLMASGPNGWRLNENVFAAPPGGSAMDVFSVDGTAKLSVLSDYHLDGVVISNDEPGAFTSSGSRDNAIFNIAIQGPVETNNGFLKYEDELNSDRPLNPDDRTYGQYNPLTGVINSRSVEAHARGSAESGMHIEKLSGMPGRVGNQFATNQGKVDFVANYCGTYSLFPSQMFDRRVEILNTLYLGLRAYKLSTQAKMQVTDEDGNKVFPPGTSEQVVEATTMYFYQYLPFSSRAATVIQAVTDKHEEMIKEALVKQGVDPTPEAVAQRVRSGLKPTRDEAAAHVKAVKQQTETALPSAKFDTATYDPIRTEDLWSMCGAWRVGRVMDTKAAVHDRYAGGPRDTAFSCIVDVGVAWSTVLPIRRAPDPLSQPTGFLLPPNEGGYVRKYDNDGKPIPNPRQEQRSGQQDSTCLANNHAPPLTSTLGRDVGRSVRGDAPVDAAMEYVMRDGGEGSVRFGDAEPAVAEPPDTKKLRQRLEELREQREQQEQARKDEEMRLALQKGELDTKGTKTVANKKKQVADDVRKLLESNPKALALVTKDEGTDPMEKVVAILRKAGADLRAVNRASSDKWGIFVGAKESLKNAMGSGKSEGALKLQREAFEKRKTGWRDAVKAEVKEIVAAIKQEDGTVPEAIVTSVAQHYEALVSARDAIDEYRKEDKNVNVQLEAEMELGKFLNRANHFVFVFTQLMAPTGAGTAPASNLVLDNIFESTDAAMLEGIILTEKLLHFSAMCDLHAAHIDLDDPRFEPPEPAPAPAPAVAPVAATPAAASKPAGKARGKSPTRPRPTPTGAAAAASSSAAAKKAAAPTPAPVAVPAAAAGMSSTPLVPTAALTGAAMEAAPRRRARDTGDSVTNSLFANMFSAAPTESAVEEAPASPTPSSGSEGPSSGPRTFRRQR